MYPVYFGFDAFLFIWVVYVKGRHYVYVRGRHYVYVFLCFLCFLFHIWYMIIDLYYEVIHGICLLFYVL